MHKICKKSHKNTINLNIGLYIVIKRQLKPQGLNYPSSDLFNPELKIGPVTVRRPRLYGQSPPIQNLGTCLHKTARARVHVHVGHVACPPLFLFLFFSVCSKKLLWISRRWIFGGALVSSAEGPDIYSNLGHTGINDGVFPLNLSGPSKCSPLGCGGINDGATISLGTSQERGK